MKIYTHDDFKIGLIYCYTSPSGKKYIGQTINERARKQSHKRGTSETMTKFGNAIRKYGFNNFKYEVLIKFKPTIELEKLIRVLNKLEQRYIRINNTVNEGYNLTTGGDNFLHAEETKQKISNYASNMTEEHKEKLSVAAKKRIANEDEETFKKRVSNLVNTEITAEQKVKMSQTQNAKKIKVYQCDLEGNVLKGFHSINDAARSIDSTSTVKTRANRIGECINGTRATIYGYTWTNKSDTSITYEEKYNGKYEDKRKKELKEELPKTKQVINQYDLEDKLLNSFDTIVEAANSLDLTSVIKTRVRSIGECVNGKRITAYGFKWIRE